MTGELTKSVANKESHLPSRGVRCDRRGRVRAQAPGKTQQKMKNSGGKKAAREKRQRRRLMITGRESHTKADFATQKAKVTSLSPQSAQILCICCD